MLLLYPLPTPCLQGALYHLGCDLLTMCLSQGPSPSPGAAWMQRREQSGPYFRQQLHPECHQSLPLERGCWVLGRVVVLWGFVGYVWSGSRPRGAVGFCRGWVLLSSLTCDTMVSSHPCLEAQLGGCNKPEKTQRGAGVSRYPAAGDPKGPTVQGRLLGHVCVFPGTKPSPVLLPAYPCTLQRDVVRGGTIPAAAKFKFWEVNQQRDCSHCRDTLIHV